MVPILHAYDRQVPDRAVMAFVPNEEMRQTAVEAGAVHAGGVELINEIVRGRIDLVSHHHHLQTATVLELFTYTYILLHSFKPL